VEREFVAEVSASLLLVKVRIGTITYKPVGSFDLRVGRGGVYGSDKSGLGEGG
jgi:hypothetical protein